MGVNTCDASFYPLRSKNLIAAARAQDAPCAAVTAIVSHYLGRAGVLIGLGIVMLPVIYIHGIWLPRHGVNGWTAEPREKYYALRGWAPEER